MCGPVKTFLRNIQQNVSTWAHRGTWKRFYLSKIFQHGYVYNVSTWPHASTGLTFPRGPCPNVSTWPTLPTWKRYVPSKNVCTGSYPQTFPRGQTPKRFHGVLGMLRKFDPVKTFWHFATDAANEPDFSQRFHVGKNAPP